MKHAGSIYQAGSPHQDTCFCTEVLFFSQISCKSQKKKCSVSQILFNKTYQTERKSSSRKQFKHLILGQGNEVFCISRYSVSQIVNISRLNKQNNLYLITQLKIEVDYKQISYSSVGLPFGTVSFRKIMQGLQVGQKELICFKVSKKISSWISHAYQLIKRKSWQHIETKQIN